MAEFNYKNFFNRLDDILSGKREIKKNYDKARNTNSELCKKCGGMCCKKCGCHFSPEDFKDTSFNTLKEEIQKGYISIDWVDGEMVLRDGGVYILRARNVGMPIVDVSHNRSSCILWDEKNGCKLSYEERPTGGKLLIPKTAYNSFSKKTEYMCHEEYDISDCCDEWKAHQKTLVKLVDYFRYRDYPCIR